MQGVSQRELADALGTSQQQVARWEASDYRSASFERVAAAADVLGLSVDAPQVVSEPIATYGLRRPVQTPAVNPVRDVGEIAVRLRAHSDELRDQFGLERIGVFGSFATGEQGATSDVDLLVETPEPGGMRFIEAALFIEDLLDRSVDLVRPELLRDPIRERVCNEVIYVWST